MRYPSWPRRYSIDGIMPDVDGLLVQQRGALGRRVEAQREAGADLEPVDQRPRIQIGDGAETDHRHVGWLTGRAPRSARLARPARAPPPGCCRGFPRAGCAASRASPVDRRHPIDVVGAHRSATCASLGP